MREGKTPKRSLAVIAFANCAGGKLKVGVWADGMVTDVRSLEKGKIRT